MNQVTAILATTFFFYLLVPGIGAFVVRARWRRFRRYVIKGSQLPILSYAALRGGVGGSYRFFGRLEAVQGDHRVWLSDGRLSVALELERVSIYAVPSVQPTEGGRSTLGRNETPRMLTWESLGSLPEGTPFFVSGVLEMREGAPVFKDRGGEKLFVILYEENDRRLLTRAIWCGRQRNEYWNLFTPVALAAGFVAHLLLAYLFFREGSGRVFGLASLTLGLVPALPLFPPGIIPFFGYRRLWAKGRLLRARRDLLRLPTRFSFAPVDQTRWQAPLPTGGAYVKEIVSPHSHWKGYPIRRGVEEGPNWFRFYQLRAEDGSEDPWAESVVVAGDPDILAQDTESKARRLEILSIVLFSISIVVNSYLAFLALSYLL